MALSDLRVLANARRLRRKESQFQVRRGEGCVIQSWKYKLDSKERGFSVPLHRKGQKTGCAYKSALGVRKVVQKGQ